MAWPGCGCTTNTGIRGVAASLWNHRGRMSGGRLPSPAAAADTARAIMRTLPLVATLLAVLVAIIVLTRFMNSFHDWDREQTCAAAGARNCGERIPLN